MAKLKTRPRGQYERVRQLPWGTCRVCHNEVKVRLDGLVRYHHQMPWDRVHCAGSRCLPNEGVLMDCLWCSRLFISEDEGHRFCSEACAATWESEDGTWMAWPLEEWLKDRREREEV